MKTMIHLCSSLVLVVKLEYSWADCLDVTRDLELSNIRSENDSGSVVGAGGLLLIATGCASAFAVASCCALPLLFAALGLSAAWLFAIGILAVNHRGLFILVSLITLLGGGALLKMQWRVKCSTDAWCRRRWVRLVTVGAVSAGLALLAGGYRYA